MLNDSSIQQHLKSAGFKKPIYVHVLESVDSTNQFLKELSASNAIDVCCAETQTHGRGRFGRDWCSPFGENIYFSMRYHFDSPLSQLSGLGLVVSMAILAVLNETTLCKDVCIKWPNDLLWQGKKLCGNLIEAIGKHHDGTDVVIGIGLNVNSTAIDKPWCSLYEITSAHFNRNTLIAKLIIQLDHHIQQFCRFGFSSFIPNWKKTDYLYGQRITVTQPTRYLSGTANGVNDAGQLILIDEAGIVHYLSSGDTSLQI